MESLLSESTPLKKKPVSLARIGLKFTYLAFLLLTIWLSGCGKAPEPKKNSSNSLKGVRFWAYQIDMRSQERDIKKLTASHYDLVVIDQLGSLKGEGNQSSTSDVAKLKESANSSGGKKTVLSYINIGEAEDYRTYWRKKWQIGNPEWIVADDPDGWNGNFPVKFWQSEWKSIVKRRINRIIADGYDGVYLDWLEIYSFAPVAEAARSQGLDVRTELISFIGELSAYARSIKPEFLFIAQNASELGEFPEYVALFDGIAQEHIWYDGGDDPDTSEMAGDIAIDPRESKEYIKNLRKWLQRNKTVFHVEYAQSSSNVRRAYRLGQEQGFKGYVTLRELDNLTATPPPGYR